MSVEDGAARKRVCVIGGGLSGLSAAYRLVKEGRSSVSEVDLYEADGRLGGVVKTGRSKGWVFDLGPNSAAAKHAEVEKMLLDLTSGRAEEDAGQRVFRQERSKAVLIWKNGQSVPVPNSISSLIGSPLLSAKGKWRIFGDLFVFKRRSSKKDAGAESLESFFSRRFGREMTDYVISPMVAGIYSGKPDNLSVKYTFPAVYRAEARGIGSVILGTLFGRAKDPDAPKPRKTAIKTRDLRLSFNFRGGMESLIGNFREKLEFSGSPFKLRLKTPVRKLCYEPGRSSWLVNGKHRYDAVISAMPAHTLGDVQVCGDMQNSFLAYALLAISKTVTYAPMAAVVLGYRTKDVSHDLDAFGILTPEKEKRKALGTTFASSLYPYRTPDNKSSLFNVYLGGSRQPELMDLKKNALIDVADRELRDLVGTTSKPIFSSVYKWDKAIPQSALEYGRVVETVKEIEKVYPGFYFAGNWRGLGIGVPDAMRSGLLAAGRVLGSNQK